MIKTFTKIEIYNMADNISKCFTPETTMPVPINLIIQNNIAILSSVVTGIEEDRTKILNKYGTLDEEEQKYHFEDDIIDQVNAELKELFDTEVELEYTEISIKDLSNTYLNFVQAQAISYMIGE